MADVFSCVSDRADVPQGRCPVGYSEVPGLPIFAPYPTVQQGTAAVTAGFVVALVPALVFAHLIGRVKKLAASG